MKEQEYNKNFEPRTWLRIFKHAWKDKPAVLGLISVMILTAAADTVFPLMTRHAIDHFVVPRKFAGLGGFTMGYAALAIVQAINVFLLIALAGRIETRMVYSLRNEGFAHLQRLDFTYFDTTSAGWIMARMTNDAQRLGDVVAWGMVDFFWGFSVMIGFSGVMLWLNLKLALIVLSVIPGLVALSLFFQRRILKYYRVTRKTNSLITAAITEAIHGATTTKTLVREEANLNEFVGLTGTMRSASIRAAVQSALYLPLVSLLGIVGTGLALSMGGNAVRAGFLSCGALVAFITYTMLFFDPVRELARIFGEFQNAQASAERVFSMINTPVRIADDPERIQPGLEPVRGGIEFAHVDFAYKDGCHVLQGFNLNIRAGEKVALVGETGAGKTTIVNLLSRFYQPTGGEIRIDGLDYTRMPLHHLQSRIGAVLQTPHLFSGSVRENIRYGRLDASDAEVEAAAEMVNAGEFIAKLEKGFDTEVGEGGNLLSTGQKQLISFARAILADPAIFILDEATSSVDTQTEHRIQEAIDRLLVGRTSIIIAHRLSTIRSADRILVLEHGKIVEEGAHRVLMKLKGRYFRLYTNQFMEEKEREMLSA
jgi:ATP-binding cassette, subfamily B, bacterial